MLNVYRNQHLLPQIPTPPESVGLYTHENVDIFSQLLTVEKGTTCIMKIHISWFAKYWPQVECHGAATRYYKLTSLLKWER